MKRELARLKSDLEKVFREEKMLAVETEKRIKEHEITNHRQIWEKKLEDIKMEVSDVIVTFLLLFSLFSDKYN